MAFIVFADVVGGCMWYFVFVCLIVLLFMLLLFLLFFRMLVCGDCFFGCVGSVSCVVLVAVFVYSYFLIGIQVVCMCV